MFTRRGFSSLLGATPLAAVSLSQQGAVPYPRGYPATSPVSLYKETACEPNKPIMSHHEAVKLLFKDNDLLNLYTSQLYEIERRNGIPHIEPDIDVYKSFSKNAKITFQRQRNVKRNTEDRMSPHYGEGSYGILTWMNEKISKLVWG
jgi:hypothetical protein